MFNSGMIYNRVKNILLTPSEEWKRIQLESYSKKEVLRGFAIPLLILIFICSVAGNIIFLSRESFSIGYDIASAVKTFIVIYFSIYISSLIINEITPSFNSIKNPDKVFQLVIYSYTAFFIMTAFSSLLQPLGIIQVFAIYSIYVFWMGCETLLGTPEDNKVGFVVVSNLIILLVFGVTQMILNHIVLALFTAGIVLHS